MAVKNKHLQTIFIVSTGRTGTTFLINYLSSAFPNCKAVDERNFYTFRLLSNMRFSKLISTNISKLIISKLRSDLHNQGHLDLDYYDYYIEFNSLVGVIDILAELFPESKFIHIVRDPRDYVRSVMNWGSFRGIKGIFNRFLPYWTLRLIQKNWHSYTEIEILSHLWDMRNREIERELSYVKQEQKVRLKFEDIFLSEDYEGLKRLQAFIGLDEEIKMEIMKKTDRNASKSDLLLRWSEWNTMQCQQLYKICHELMNKYGYGKEPLWLEKLKQ